MKARPNTFGRSTGERGAVLFLVAAMVVVFLGVAALAVDLGAWYVARSDAQRAAEAGAHAGASIFMASPGDEAGARAEAEQFAELNTVQWVTPDVFPDDDIDVIVDSQKVRVRVQRSGERGNPLGTMFAKAMGINTVDIGAMAAAQVWPGISTDCILPFAVPDRWAEWDPILGDWRDPVMGDVFDGAPDYYDPGPGGTGYEFADVGQQLQLSTGDSSEAPQPGWYMSIALPGSQGGSDFRDSIVDCWLPSGDNQIGDETEKEPGNMVGPTGQGFRDIFNDPDEQGQSWSNECGCPVHSDGTPVSATSRRIRPIVMFDPTVWLEIENGRKDFPITNLAGIWMESFDGGNAVTVRWLAYTAVQPAENWEDASGGLLRILRIVE